MISFRYMLLLFCVQLFSQTPTSYCFKVEYGGRVEGTDNIVNVEQITNGYKTLNTNVSYSGSNLFFQFTEENLPVSNVDIYYHNCSDTFNLYSGDEFDNNHGYIVGDLENLNSDTFELKLDYGNMCFRDHTSPVIHRNCYVIITFPS